MARILVVDDEQGYRAAVASLLSSQGHEVITAHEGGGAIEAAMADRPDLILMDVQMPGMDGDQATRLLRERGFRAPILALTGDASDEVRACCLEAGCEAVLDKPIGVDGLLKAIAAALKVRAGA